MSTLPSPPDLDDRHVRRPRLYQWLDPPGARLTLVAGFPGCGKTALVREWLDTGDAANAAWVALGNPGLQSPRRFWAAVFDGLHGVDDRYGTPERAALRRTGLVTESLLAGLVDQLDNADRPVVLVLDGFEAITDDATQRSLAWFLEHRPLTLRVVMSTRREPLLPLGRWRARGELAEVREPDLALTGDDIGPLLPHLGHEWAVLLAERTEGWATAVGLASAAAQRAPEPRAVLARLDGTEPAIGEFLVREGWRPEPAARQRFLATSAVLDSFNAGLCDGVLERTDSAPLLADLAARHVFVVPLARPGRWFRYHRLFADVLRRELHRAEPGRAQEIQRRAGRWHARTGPPETAITYALDGDDQDLLVEQLSAHHVDLAAGGRWPLVLRSLELISDDKVPPGPQALDLAWLLAANGLPHRAAALARRTVEECGGRLPRPARATAALVEAAAAAAAGDDEAFFAVAPRVDVLLGEDHPGAAGWPSLKAWVLGLGDHFGAASAVAAAAGHSGSPHSAAWTAVASALRAEILVRQGQLRAGAAEARAALTAWPLNFLHPALGAALRARAWAAVEADRFDEAEDLLRRAQQIQTQAPMPIQGALTAVALAELARARGRAADADAILEREARTRYATPPGPLYHSYLAESWIRVELDLGATARAAERLETVALQGRAAILAAQVAVANGRPIDAATLAGAAGTSVRHHIETQLVLARVALPSDPLGAAAHLEAARNVGEPEGFDRIFRTDPRLAPLYNDQRDRWLSDGIFDLTAREVDVLRGLVKDEPYRQIATELFLSVNTVKTHARSMYRKLGVHDRGEAARRAAELGLL